MRRVFVMSHSATAPEKMRTDVNVAGSISVSFKARRQSSELLANATIASDVSRKMRDLVNLVAAVLASNLFKFRRTPISHDYAHAIHITTRYEAKFRAKQTDRP